MTTLLRKSSQFLRSLKTTRVTITDEVRGRGPRTELKKFVAGILPQDFRFQILLDFWPQKVLELQGFWV